MAFRLFLLPTSAPQLLTPGCSPKKAEGETVPLLRETMTLMPVSMKGTEKSMTSDLSSLMVKEPTAMWAFFNTT